MRLRAAGMLGLAALACSKAQTAPLYEKSPVTRRDVVVTVVASGVIQPVLTFRVKSKAWGQILSMPVQTGDEVKKGQLLVTIDPRLPRDNLTQAQADLSRAQAQLVNASAQFKRSEALYQSQSIAETDYEHARLALATAQAGLVKAQATLQTAQDAMDDTKVRAPITGTILLLEAVLGSMISSPTLGGGTVILDMANLDTVRDSAMVVETEIGRIVPGMPVTITVDAFPDRTFEGTVQKIGPQAQVVQNATTFPVFVAIPNPGHLLKPGMNTDLRIHTGERQGVLAIPNAALRTPRDLGTAAGVLGLDSNAVAEQVAAARSRPASPTAGGDTASRGRGQRPGDTTPSGKTFTTPNGRTITLPPGVTPEQVQTAFRKRMNGEDLTPAEQAMLSRLRSQFQGGGGPGTGGGGGGGYGRGRSGARGGRGASAYVVFAVRNGTFVPVPITTGLTDQDYVEVTSGLTAADTVLVLPSASLVQSQQQFRQRFQNVTGGGLPGLRQQQPARPGNAR